MAISLCIFNILDATSIIAAKSRRCAHECDRHMVRLKWCPVCTIGTSNVYSTSCRTYNYGRVVIRASLRRYLPSTFCLLNRYTCASTPVCWFSTRFHFSCHFLLYVGALWRTLQCGEVIWRRFGLSCWCRGESALVADVLVSRSCWQRLDTQV